MAEWQQFDPSKLYPTEIKSLLDSFDKVVTPLSIALEAMADVVGIAAEFVVGMQDANAEAIELLYDQINLVIQQLTQTGVYHLFYHSPSFAHRLPPSTWLSDVANSLNDRMDDRRPILVDPDAYVGAVVVLSCSTTLSGLMTQYNNMYAAFKGTCASLLQIGNWPTPGSPFVVTPGVGQYPNWSSKRLQDVIPGLGDVVEKLYAFMSAIAPAPVSSGLYTAFAELLADKAALLNLVVTKILEVLNIIEIVLNFQGAYILPIYGTGDAAWFRRELLTSTGGPRDLGPEYEYSVGTVFLTTGGTNAATLLSMFGVTI